MANNNHYKNTKRSNGEYAFNANAAYDLSGFNAARPEPKPQPVQEPKYMPKFVIVDKPQHKSKSQLRAEEHSANVRVLKTVVVAFLLFGLLGAVMYGESMKNELTKEISSTEKQLNLEQSENARLNLTLGTMFSMDNIEQYASEQLGMVKMQNYQVNYINLAEKEAQAKAESEAKAKAEAEANAAGAEGGNESAEEAAADNGDTARGVDGGSQTQQPEGGQTEQE